MDRQTRPALSGEPGHFLNGEIRDALGLSSDDLSVGLEVAGHLPSGPIMVARTAWV